MLERGTVDVLGNAKIRLAHHNEESKIAEKTLQAGSAALRLAMNSLA